MPDVRPTVFDFLATMTKKLLIDSPMTPLRERLHRVHARIADHRNEIIRRHTTEELQLEQIISRKRATEEIPFLISLDDEAPTEQLPAVPMRTTDPEIATFAHDEICPVTIERTTFPLRTEFPGSVERGAIEHMKQHRLPRCVLLSENRLISLQQRFPEKFKDGYFVADNPALPLIPYGTDSNLDDLTIAYIS